MSAELQQVVVERPVAPVYLVESGVAGRMQGRHRSCSCFSMSSRGSERRSRSRAAEHHGRRSRQRSRDSRRSDRSRSARRHSRYSSDDDSGSSGCSARRSVHRSRRSSHRREGGRPSRRNSPVPAVPDPIPVAVQSPPREVQQSGVPVAVAGSSRGGMSLPPDPVGFNDPRVRALVGSSVTPPTWRGHVLAQVTAGGRFWNTQEGLEGDLPAWGGWHTASGFRR